MSTYDNIVRVALFRLQWEAEAGCVSRAIALEMAYSDAETEAAALGYDDDDIPHVQNRVHA